ncbi:unnamed protein product, partial [marine sediment metagenome]
AEISLSTFYRAELDRDEDGAIFKISLKSGKTYRVANDSFINEPLFDGIPNGGCKSIKYWSPSDWTGDVSDMQTGLINQEDSGIKWCPYNYKLNVYSVDVGWFGGYRAEIECNETGWWVFLFTPIWWPE